MTDLNLFDLFAQRLEAQGYSAHTVGMYPSRVRSLSRRLNLATSTPAQRQALLDGYANSTRVTLLAAYRVWRSWLADEFPDELASWPPLSGEGLVAPPPVEVLEAINGLCSILGRRTVQALRWEQVDLDLGRVYGRIAGAVVKSSVLGRGDRVRGWCRVLLDWSLEGEVPDPGWHVVVKAPGSTRPVTQKVLSAWCMQALAAPDAPAAPSNRRSMGPLPPVAPPPPERPQEGPQKAVRARAGGSEGVEVPEEVKTSLRAALGREPSQAELLAAMAGE
jgi:hypothetical protein